MYVLSHGDVQCAAISVLGKQPVLEELISLALGLYLGYCKVVGLAGMWSILLEVLQEPAFLLKSWPF